MFQRVILSSNENPSYIEFWPLVSWAWRALFNVPVTLALVTKRRVIDSFIIDLCSHGEVMIFPEIEGIPSANNAKMARHYAAGEFPDEICLINDIDLLVLQKTYLKELMTHYKDGNLLCAGADQYKDKEEGKFPIGYITAKGSIFKEILNPKSLRYEDFIQSFIGMNVFDHKEDISRTVHNEDPDTFSDESLYRAMISKWTNKANVIRRPRGFDLYIEKALDRADWQIDLKKLKNNIYIEAHLPRPCSQYRDTFYPLVKHITEEAIT